MGPAISEEKERQVRAIIGDFQMFGQEDFLSMFFRMDPIFRTICWSVDTLIDRCNSNRLSERRTCIERPATPRSEANILVGAVHEVVYSR